MSKRIALTLFAVLAIALTACQRTASTPVPTQSLDFPSAPTIESIQSIMIAGTQTAIALYGTPEGGQEQPETPDPNATQAPIVISADTPAPENPTPLPAVTPIPATTDKPSTYTLQKGEFPFCIARRFNIDPDELLALNGLTRSQSYFTPGTVLKIPQAGKAFPGARALLAHPTQYTVLSGDTIYSIACKFGDVDPLAIASQNGLQPPYTLTVGSQISIP
jgi:LysM repeat protein